MFFSCFVARVRRTRRIRQLSWVVALILVAPVWADTSSSVLRFDDALRQAVAQAPLMQAQQARITSAQEEAARAGALPDPQLSVGIDNLDTQGPGAFTAGGDSMTMRILGISQALPSSSKRQAERAMGAANVDLASAEQTTTTLAIRQRVAEAWIMAWSAQHEHAMLSALQDAWNDDAAVAKARLRSGSGSAADVLAARMEVLDLANRIDDVTAREAQARVTLARWLGAPIEQPLGDPPDLSVLPADETMLLAHVDQLGPLLGWSSREQVAEAALDEARADKHPQWSVSMGYGSRVRGLSDMVSLQVGVSLPLFTRNRQDRGISARAADLDAVRDEHEDARLQQIEAIRGAWAQWQSLGQQVHRHLEVLLPLANDRASLALASYRAGGDIQPLLQARRDELSHHVDYARMLADYGHAWVTLAYLLPEGETP
jgi:cobalt-zinc-cadmium efflux system outer membrane protein